MREFASAVVIIYCGELQDIILYRERTTAKKYSDIYKKEHDGDSDYKVFLSASTEVLPDKEV